MNGDTYSYQEEIQEYLKSVFNLDIENLSDYLILLEQDMKIIRKEEKIYLIENYDYENSIATNLLKKTKN